MTALPQGCIDVDLHPTVPSMAALRRYLPGFWQEVVVDRDITSLESVAYPPNAPLTARPDWRGAEGRAATSLAAMRAQALDPWGVEAGILNCLYGVHLVFNEDLAAVLATALNDWVAEEWLAQDARLRASIVVPMQSVERAVEEIERRAADPRFVQVLVPVMGEVPYGRRALWPVWRACARHGLPLAIHAGSAYRHPPTSLGWPSYFVEDYAAQSLGFQSQLASLVTEGVFQEIPDLRVVLLESGVSWLPGFLWRLAKFWRGVRAEVPWLVESPAAVVRRHVRLSVTPFDVPEDAATVAQVLDQVGGAEMLLWASDYPHWQFDGVPCLPAGLSATEAALVARDNARAFYPRLAKVTA